MLQARATAARFAQQRWDCVYSSDLRRASDTAKTIVPELSAIRMDQRLRECCLGVRENLPRGTTVEEAKQIVAAKLGVSVAEVEDKAETLDDLAKRAVGFVEDELVPCVMELAVSSAQLGRAEANVLVVSHGGLLRAMMNYLAPRLGRRSVVSNCSVSKFVARIVEGAVRFSLEYVDDVSHLAELDRLDPSASEHDCL